jgi:hypothetical protein
LATVRDALDAMAMLSAWLTRSALVRTLALGPGSCEAAVSRPHRRGCRLTKRRSSVAAGLRLCGGADAVAPTVHAGRCTRSVSLPRGMGCRHWNRRTVAVGALRTLLAWVART